MNRRIFRWLLTGILGCCIGGVQAQEPGFAPGAAREIPGNAYIPQGITLPEPIPFAQWNRTSRTKPHNWEQLLNEQVARERAWEQSVLLSGLTGESKRLEVSGRAAVWNFRIGNSTASWSISTGSHLDARTLSFPMPRNMTPNRPTGRRVSPNGQIKR